MRFLFSALIALQMASVPATGLAAEQILPRTAVTEDVYEHGGGCRKSSPPGQCCHMDRRTGIVHCH